MLKLRYDWYINHLFKHRGRVQLALISCFTFKREICYQKIYSIGHMMCELVTLRL